MILPFTHLIVITLEVTGAFVLAVGVGVGVGVEGATGFTVRVGLGVFVAVGLGASTISTVKFKDFITGAEPLYN